MKLDAHHIAALLQELGPGCQISAEKLHLQLNGAHAIYKADEWPVSWPTAAQERAKEATRRKRAEAIRKAVRAGADILSPETVASIERDLTAERPGYARALRNADRRDKNFGQRGGGREASLLVDLGRIFKAATGKRPTVSDFKAEVGEDAYGGHFLRFARLALTFMGVRIPDSTISTRVSSPDYRMRFSEEKNSSGFTVGDDVNIETVTHDNGVTDDKTRDPGRPDRGSR